MYNIGIPSFSGKPGTRIKASQNMAFNIWRRYMVSENVNVCWRRRAIVSLGDSDLSNRPIAAINATEMVRNVREKTVPGREGILADGISYERRHRTAPYAEHR
jgi:hypothetical protein